MSKNFAVRISDEGETKSILNYILSNGELIKLAITRNGVDWQVGRFTEKELIKLNEVITKYLRET